ncbi:MAG: beta-galactosidase [Elusimicrobia bacterium]|nr:beta-galactosidase [Elusimicrobiota bacterium]
MSQNPIFRRRARFLAALVGLIAALSRPVPAGANPRPAFVLHFNFLSSAAEERHLIDVAQKAGATALVVVPPSHVWEDPPSLAVLDDIFAEAERRGLQIAISRIDACQITPLRDYRPDFLFAKILTEPGRLPNGQPSASFFLSTVGRPDYDRWMEEETRFYAKRYGRRPCLIGFTMGALSETIVSQRGGLLQYMTETESYEFTQYTPAMKERWAAWLARRFGTIETLNGDYATRFAVFDDVPMPKNDSDERFGRADRAYFDFAACINDWVEERYHRCRAIWHDNGAPANVPFLIHFSGFDAEKFALGHPGLAALDLPGWIADADGVGLSLYTNGGYPDFGHGSVRAMVGLLGLARELGKPALVLEGGCEDPTPVIKESELTFFATAALPLAPLIVAYEFLHDPYGGAPEDDSARLVDGAGHVRRRAALAVSKALALSARGATPAEEPALTCAFDPASARNHPRIALVYKDLYALAGVLPVRWIPARREDTRARAAAAWRPTGEDPLSKLIIEWRDAAPARQAQLLAEIRAAGKKIN